MWLLVAVALAREPAPECAGRLYEGTLIEVAGALAIPGVTITAENARKREHVALCTDPPPVTAAAIGGVLMGAGLLGYCIELNGTMVGECRQPRTVNVIIDDAGRAHLREIFGHGEVSVLGSLEFGMPLRPSAPLGARHAAVTLLTQ